jgi:outer membrane lipoprotein-sorting protein
MGKLIFLFCLSVPLSLCAQVETEKNILTRMLQACENLKSASFILATKERVKNGSIENGEMLIKLQRNPLNLYMHLYRPNGGTEILYRHGHLNGHIYISLGSFPYLNVKMDPDHNTVRKNSHHSVRDIGFDYLMRMIRHYQTVFEDKVYDYLEIGDTVQFERHRCITLEFNYPNFGYIPYTVQPGENVVEIGNKKHVHEYMIVCANKAIDNVHDVKAGQKIQVPNMFARKIIFLVDTRTMLPLVQEIHDEKGFFERYEYRSFVLNPSLNELEFSTENPDYGF